MPLSISRSISRRYRLICSVAGFGISSENAAVSNNTSADPVKYIPLPSRHSVVINGNPILDRAVIEEIPAHHRERFGGSNGTLRLREDGIDYVSRSWRWSDIRTLANPDSYEFRVTAYREIVEFDLKQPMSRELFDKLWDRLSAADLNVVPPPQRSIINDSLGRFGLIVLAAIASLQTAHATSLAELLDEAGRNNPDIAASMRAQRAAAQVSSQVSTLPDPQVTVQQFAVGSPRPFAGSSNSNFAYIGFGISQDIPYPGKLSLKGEAAQRDAAVTREIG